MYRSDYYLSLSGDLMCRYDRKMEIIDNVDPYAIPIEKCKLNLHKLPNITMMDLAYKSLQAYKQFEAGFVQGVLAKQFNDEAFVVIAKVQHSQRKREKLHKVWVIILKDTNISSAHCTCMARLSEVCSHVSTVLFFLHARPNTLEDSGPGPSCIEQLSLWPVPPMKKVEMLREHALCLDKEELCTLLTKLQEIDIQPAICRLLEMANSVPQNLPRSSDKWYSPNMDQCKAIEATTREQSQNSTWFKYRAARIFASRCKAVCRTTIDKPSLTVVKGVCYPQKYEKYYKDQHTNFMLSASGFIISQKYSEVGASPDGLWCHVPVVIWGVEDEVECPYLLADATSFEDFASKKHTCLTFNFQ
ncbi:unnamed protein product [Ceutorhynchus assimilis]|uniref:SWIM-type domain-containing protein n=1 Tax=Ceutorhynchus assimilis TaxID=467358 RepID=A0A9N9QL42_9CUCU|nr:unnamed protein product [Ceutorhynchus assimilis]